MHLTDDDKQIECRSTSGSKQSTTIGKCTKGFKKVRIFGHGMDDKDSDFYGKLSESGNIINVHFNKTTENKISIEDENVPLKFTDYCVSMTILINVMPNFPDQISVKNGILSINKDWCL